MRRSLPPPWSLSTVLLLACAVAVSAAASDERCAEPPPADVKAHCDTVQRGATWHYDKKAERCMPIVDGATGRCAPVQDALAGCEKRLFDALVQCRPTTPGDGRHSTTATATTKAASGSDNRCAEPSPAGVKAHCDTVLRRATSWHYDKKAERCVPDVEEAGSCAPVQDALASCEKRLFDALVQCKQTTPSDGRHSTTAALTATASEQYACPAYMDIAMLLDGSKSIEWDAWPTRHSRPGHFDSYVKRIAWEVGARRRRQCTKEIALAAFVFSGGTRLHDTVEFDRGTARSNEEFKARVIADLHYPAGATNTETGLRMAANHLWKLPGIRRFAKRMQAVVLVTDGEPDVGWANRHRDTEAIRQAVDMAHTMRTAGITIVSVGVGYVDSDPHFRQTLIDISGDAKLVFTATERAAIGRSADGVMDTLHRCYRCIQKYGGGEPHTFGDCSDPKCVKEFL